MAANAEVGIAFTNMFPKITLTAQFGAESDEIKNLFQSPAHFLSGSLLTPLFPPWGATLPNTKPRKLLTSKASTNTKNRF